MYKTNKFLLDGQESSRLLFRNVLASDFDAWLEFFKGPITSRFWLTTPETPHKLCSNVYAKNDVYLFRINQTQWKKL